MEKAPEFLVMLEPVKVKEGEPITLTCQVTGSPEPELTWLVEKRQIVPVKNRSVSCAIVYLSVYSYLRTFYKLPRRCVNLYFFHFLVRYVFTVEEGVCKLEILDTTPNDTGEYVVVASNSVGEVTCAATVEVEEKPKEPKEPKTLKPEFTEVFEETVRKI